MRHTENELTAVALGLDRGVALPLATTDGASFGQVPIQLKRLAVQAPRLSWQRRQAGPRNGVKAKQKVARSSAGQR